MAPARPEAFPAQLALNAWDGGGDAMIADVAPSSFAFARRPLKLDRREYLAPDKLADPADWRDQRVGWGLVLPDVDPNKMPIADQARAADIPELAPLLEARPGAAVFRYRKGHPPTHLQRCLPDGSVKDIDIAGSLRGSAPDQLPAYLTIVALPKDIPWGFQGVLSTRAAVGRLPLERPQLANYVAHLVGDWQDAATSRDDVVVWAVDWGEQDITRLLRRAIADPLAAKFAAESDIQLRHLDGGAVAGDGEAAAFVEAVTEAKPGLIVSTSHGATFPVDDAEKMRPSLGLPVDQRRQVLRPANLLRGWEPDGAIWYAHACCGAGSAALSDFVDLVKGDERVVALLEGVSRLGETVGPLPLALLGADKPLRAFVGHVEPTFDWTIRGPLTGQYLSGHLVHGLYDQLFQTTPRPLGLAMHDWYGGAATALVTWDDAMSDVKKGEVREDLLGALLAARDRLGQVILGDPTVVLAPRRA